MSASAPSRRHVYGLIILIISCVLSLNPYFLLLMLLPGLLGLGLGLIISSELPADRKTVLCLLPLLVPVFGYIAWLL